MTLATRCPQCQTVFRVVQDQLRVSEGWVRCGRCTEVFNAAQNLVDPATGETRRAPIEVRSGLARPVDVEPPPPPQAPPPDGTPAGTAEEAIVAAQEAGPAPLPPEAAAASLPADVPAAADERAEEAGSVAPLPPQAPGADEALAPAALRAAAAGAPTLRPSFLRRAERAERWRHPAVRAALALGIVAASALLATQWLVEFRDYAAARWPALRPALAQACATLGCRIEPLRAIEALVVDSSGLVRVEKSDLYRLGVALRNRRELDVALPAVELTLTDTQGQLIARRVLRAGELGATAPTLAAQAELALQATLRVAGTPVAGYTIELFYP